MCSLVEGRGREVVFNDRHRQIEAQRNLVRLARYFLELDVGIYIHDNS